MQPQDQKPFETQLFVLIQTIPDINDLAGKEVLVPLIDRTIPIIFDDYVDMDFGTGCLKITPAHDPNDYEIGKKHNLEVINILNSNGTLNENAQLYIGDDRFEVRKKIALELHNTGYLIKEKIILTKLDFQNEQMLLLNHVYHCNGFVQWRN